MGLISKLLEASSGFLSQYIIAWFEGGGIGSGAQAYELEVEAARNNELLQL